MPSPLALASLLMFRRLLADGAVDTRCGYRLRIVIRPSVLHFTYPVPSPELSSQFEQMRGRKLLVLAEE